MLTKLIKRDFAVNLRCFATSPAKDPIQKLFLDKIQEYRKKAAATPDGLVDADGKLAAQLQDEMERIRNNFGLKKGEEDKLTTKFDDSCKLDEIMKW